MALDKELLAAAKAAEDRLTSADNDARAARADYHHAVRRLHLAGAPLREVAQALGISHQRVQQIVQSTGGTWWSRVWRTRRPGPDMACSFCGLLSEQVDKLIAGPEVFICDGCVALAEQVQRTQKAEANARANIGPIASTRIRCSFCGRKGGDVQLLGDRESTVCHECLGLCRRILDDRSPGNGRVSAT